MNTFLAERLGIGIHRPEFTVNRNCPPGLHSALWWVAKVQLTRGAGQACFADWGTLAACLTALKLLNTLAAPFTGCLHLCHGQGLACWCRSAFLLHRREGLSPLHVRRAKGHTVRVYRYQCYVVKEYTGDTSKVSVSSWHLSTEKRSGGRQTAAAPAHSWVTRPMHLKAHHRGKSWLNLKARLNQTTAELECLVGRIQPRRALLAQS